MRLVCARTHYVSSSHTNDNYPHPPCSVRRSRIRIKGLYATIRVCAMITNVWFRRFYNKSKLRRIISRLDRHTGILLSLNRLLKTLNRMNCRSFNFIYSFLVFRVRISVSYACVYMCMFVCVCVYIYIHIYMCVSSRVTPFLNILLDSDWYIGKIILCIFRYLRLVNRLRDY